jgi:hypothetical protein
MPPNIPKVWRRTKPGGGAFASINRPIAGPPQEKELPVGKHPLQLYSLGTPNGVKVTILLKEAVRERTQNRRRPAIASETPRRSHHCPA